MIQYLELLPFERHLLMKAQTLTMVSQNSYRLSDYKGMDQYSEFGTGIFGQKLNILNFFVFMYILQISAEDIRVIFIDKKKNFSNRFSYRWKIALKCFIIVINYKVKYYYSPHLVLLSVSVILLYDFGEFKWLCDDFVSILSIPKKRKPVLKRYFLIII